MQCSKYDEERIILDGALRAKGIMRNVDIIQVIKEKHWFALDVSSTTSKR